jgi:alpha/beta superfamily hydrolase
LKAAQKKIFITGPAGNLEGIAHLPDDAPRAIAVIAHPLPTMGGTMDNKVVTTLVKTFVELGFVALRFNFRGVGASEGTFDAGDGEVEDVLAVVRHARQEYGDLPLILSGFSFGGYVQARAAQQLHPSCPRSLPTPWWFMATWMRWWSCRKSCNGRERKICRSLCWQARDISSMEN